MVGVSTSVNLPLRHKVQKFSSGTGSPGWSRKKGHKRLWCGVVWWQEGHPAHKSLCLLSLKVLFRGSGGKIEWELAELTLTLFLSVSSIDNNTLRGFVLSTISQPTNCTFLITNWCKIAATVYCGVERMELATWTWDGRRMHLHFMQISSRVMDPHFTSHGTSSSCW